MNFKEELDKRSKEVEEIIRGYLPAEDGWQRSVIEAMNYSMLSGGKRLRPMLMLETYRFFGGNGREIEPFMAAVEMIHTYSLIHDDLPVMDDDEYRRGRKTTHVVYGEAIALLAGDGLLNFAFETALKAFEIEGVCARRLAKALSVLSSKSGIYGMIGGQTADIEAENIASEKALDNQDNGHDWEAHIMFIHEHKTAALIQASMMVGAIIAGAEQDEVSEIEKAAGDIGVAFQIQDDILDITGSFAELGKPVGSDEKNNKMTYVSLKGLDAASENQNEMSYRAIKRLESIGRRGSYSNIFLMDLIRSLITRTR